MFDYLTEDELKNRLGLVYLLLAVITITFFISAYASVNTGVKWVLVLFAFGLIGFDVFRHVQYRKKSVATTQGPVGPSVASTKPPSE